jgi:hypothetical protein
MPLGSASICGTWTMLIELESPDIKINLVSPAFTSTKLNGHPGSLLRTAPAIREGLASCVYQQVARNTSPGTPTWSRPERSHSPQVVRVNDVLSLTLWLKRRALRRRSMSDTRASMIPRLVPLLVPVRIRPAGLVVARPEIAPDHDPFAATISPTTYNVLAARVAQLVEHFICNATFGSLVESGLNRNASLSASSHSVPVRPDLIRSHLVRLNDGGVPAPFRSSQLLEERCAEGDFRSRRP